MSRSIDHFSGDPTVVIRVVSNSIKAGLGLKPEAVAMASNAANEAIHDFDRVLIVHGCEHHWICQLISNAPGHDRCQADLSNRVGEINEHIFDPRGH
jgi:hypothetical protein